MCCGPASRYWRRRRCSANWSVREKCSASARRPWTGWASRLRSAKRVSARSESTRLNSSHTVIYTLSLHDALPISEMLGELERQGEVQRFGPPSLDWMGIPLKIGEESFGEIGKHTSELQSHSDLHSFPTRRSSDLGDARRTGASGRSAALRPAVPGLDGHPA